MAAGYADTALFVADLSLESPEEDEDAEDRVVLSTVHSAKGLEWEVVLIMDLVEERFPSRHAQTQEEDFEEERRLLYVACTRARRRLELYAPASVHGRGEQFGTPAALSPFVRDLPASLYEELRELYDGHLAGPERTAPEKPPLRLLPPESALPDARAGGASSPAPRLGYCAHKVFGRGKMVRFIPPDKYQVNFPGFGLKTILADYLTPED